MKNSVESHHHKTDYPLYLHKVPEQRRAPSGNPWDSLERGSQRPLPAVPADLCIRVTDRAPHGIDSPEDYAAFVERWQSKGSDLSPDAPHPQGAST